MAMAKNYIRLKGRSAGYFGFSMMRTQSFLADDHLLVVRSQGMADQVTRYYLEDIQALTCYKTSRGLICSVLFLSFAVVFAALAYVAMTYEVLAMTFFVFGPLCALFAVLFLGNIVRGPTCRTTLYTVSIVAPLENLGRLRTARNVLDRMREAVETVQGRLDRTALLAQADAGLASGPSTVAACDVPVRRQSTLAVLRPDDGQVHLWFFGLLLLLGISHFSEFFWRSDIKDTIDTIAFAVLLCIGCDALLRQRGTVLPKSLCKWTVVGMSFLMVDFFVMSLVVFALIMMSTEDAFNTSSVAFKGSPYNTAGLAVTFLGSTIIATFGLINLARFRGEFYKSTARKTKLDEGATP